MDTKVESGFQFKTESSLVHEMCIHFEDHGYTAFREVPFLGRSIDLVYVCNNRSIVAIEFKLHPRDIYRGLKQAKYCLLGADRVYVCIPKFAFSDSISLAFLDIGVGLMLVDIKNDALCKRYVIPARNRIKKREYRNLLAGELISSNGGVENK